MKFLVSTSDVLLWMHVCVSGMCTSCSGEAVLYIGIFLNKRNFVKSSSCSWEISWGFSVCELHPSCVEGGMLKGYCADK